MKGKKAIALLLTAMMAASSMAGCQSTSEKQQSVEVDKSVEVNEDGSVDSTSEEEIIQLDVYSELANYSGEMVGWFAEVLKDKFNVKINLVSGGSGVYETRMEDGDLGDIVVWGNDGKNYLQAIEAGLLFDWEEDNILEEYGPYIKEHMPYALEKISKYPPF